MAFRPNHESYWNRLTKTNYIDEISEPTYKPDDHFATVQQLYDSYPYTNPAKTAIIYRAVMEGIQAETILPLSENFITKSARWPAPGLDDTRLS